MNIELRLFLKNQFLELRQTILTALTVIVLILILVTIVLYSDNVQRQKDINSRQALIFQTRQLEFTYSELVKSLAEVAVVRSDKELRQLLASQGITPTVAPAPKPDAGNVAKPATSPAKPDAAAPPKPASNGDKAPSATPGTDAARKN